MKLQQTCSNYKVLTSYASRHKRIAKTCASRKDLEEQVAIVLVGTSVLQNLFKLERAEQSFSEILFFSWLKATVL